MRYWLGRVLESIPVLIGISLITFAIFSLAPGDPTSMLVDPTMVSDEQRAAISESLGLNDPLPTQYLRMMSGLVTGELTSFRSKRPTIDIVRDALPVTALIGGLSLFVGLLVGVPLGTIAARYPRSWADRLISMTLTASMAIPSYLAGLALVLLFANKWRIFPATGLAPVGMSGFVWPDSIRYIVLPVTVGAIGTAAIFARYLRDSMIRTLQEDYVRTARAKGLREQRVLGGHVMRNALIPVLGLLNAFIPGIIGGSVLIETLFGIPGLGRVAINAAITNDYPVVLTCVMGVAALTIATNLLVDALYIVIDPRIRIK
ncbi:MAG: ABC transporter permease [Thermomicrobiales bacterium]|nr:ABC transporter permease [Thermomicrobiales bacterium]